MSDPQSFIGWSEPWRLRATEIVGKEAAATGGQQGTDPQSIIRWHEQQLKWKFGASEIVAGEEAAAASKTPLGWVEPWRLGAAEMVGKEASAVEGQKGGDTQIIHWLEPWRLGAAEIVGKEASTGGTQKTTSA